MLTNSYSNSIFDKNYMWNDQQTHDGFDVFSPYIQGNSKATMNSVSIDDKSMKEELIQAATNRLRHRLLEQRFESFITQVVELQSRLEMIKIDTASSIRCMGAIDSLSEQQFDIFERRLDTHKEDLDIFLRRRNCSVPTNNAIVNEQKADEKSACTSSLSCLSKASFSSLSSIFLSHKSSLNEEESEYDHLGSKPQLRRRRKRQQLKKLYEDNSHQLDTDNNNSDWSESISEQQYQQQQQQQQQQLKNDQDYSQTSVSPFQSNSLKQGKIEIETEDDDDKKNDLNFSSTSFNTVDSVKDLPIHPYDYCNAILSCSLSASCSSPSSVSGSSVYDIKKETERNALDDALSFLNDLASDSDDGGFREDIYKLLDLRHNNNVRTPCSLEESGSYHYYLPQPLLSSHSIPNKKHPSFILSCIYGSLKWFRFLLIMSIAMAITLRRGPTDLFSNIHLHHPHIFMNKVW